MKKIGYLVISLDFELLWGVFDTADYQDKIEYFINTRKVIPEILELFQKFQIHATWATVGMLFNNNWKEWNNNIPAQTPSYSNQTLSAYKFGNSEQLRLDENLCFAPDIIKEIQRTPYQEIGTHTYSHYYCLEEGQNVTQFREDLIMAIHKAEECGVTLKSLVFPRNQLKEEYLEVCYELGIKNVRSNPESWYWRNPNSESIFTKLARTGDAYLPFGTKSYKLSNAASKINFPFCQMASRFLRPVEGNKVLRNLKLGRIKKEMTHAAKNNEIYHLWWHPHNFGDSPEASLEDLRLILKHYKNLHSKYNFKSLNMAELGELYIKNKLN
jgi:hypothetical protein